MLTVWAWVSNLNPDEPVTESDFDYLRGIIHWALDHKFWKTRS